MKIRGIILIFSILTFFYSCESKEQEQPEYITFDSVFESKYNPVKILGWTFHRSISIEGYLNIKMTTALKAERINLILFEKPDSMGRSITVNMSFGYNENQVERLPRYYSNDDLKVHTKNNEIAGVKDRVRITGKRYCHNSDACYIIADIVEKVQ
ncbi:MAG: hypothetical protein JXB88_17925 [Spirochaetales bacterium]|nr:hypothetical protein [Spirochaetales bacterium]